MFSNRYWIIREKYRSDSNKEIFKFNEQCTNVESNTIKYWEGRFYTRPYLQVVEYNIDYHLKR